VQIGWQELQWALSRWIAWNPKPSNHKTLNPYTGADWSARAAMSTLVFADTARENLWVLGGYYSYGLALNDTYAAFTFWGLSEACYVSSFLSLISLSSSFRFICRYAFLTRSLSQTLTPVPPFPRTCACELRCMRVHTGKNSTKKAFFKSWADWATLAFEWIMLWDNIECVMRHTWVHFNPLMHPRLETEKEKRKHTHAVWAVQQLSVYLK